VKRTTFIHALVASVALAATGFAQELKPIALPKPQMDGGKTVMQALAERKTTREFSEQALSPQMLSNLLWAAFGVNREKAERAGVGRTAPSAMNRQEVQLYVLLPEGVYLYDAQPHVLKPVAAGDIRAKAGATQAAKAAVTIVYVADSDAGSAAVDTGFIGQNVYLFSAAFGLNAWFRAGGVAELAGPLKLTEKQRVLYAQTVGYPVKK
jgi:nitroreductase